MDSSWNNSQVHFRRQGNTVFCWGQIEVNCSAWQYQELATIPDGFTPYEEVFFTGICAGASGARINAQPSSGGAKLRMMALNTALTQSVIFSTSWIAA